MASSCLQVALSPVETFIAVMEHLISKIYTSSRLPRHISIRKQIDTLVKAREHLSPFCVDLHSKIAVFLGNLSAEEKRGSLSFLPKFHQFRSKEIPAIWHAHLSHIIPAFDPILIQRASLEHALMILKNLNDAATKTVPNLLQRKEERRRSLSCEEENAIRYAAGYVVRKFKKRYEVKGPVDVVHCLLLLEEGSEMDNDDGADYSFQEYTKIWMNLIDRGGLFKVNDVTYSFFLELELSMYPLLRTSVESSTSYHKDDVLRHILGDEDVLFAWALLCVHLEEQTSRNLLSEVALHWLQIRGFSIVSQLVEEYKIVAKTHTKAKKSLRKGLQMKDLQD
jgi:hypothetical protein